MADGQTWSKGPWGWQDAYDFGEYLEHRLLGLDAPCKNIQAGRIELVDADGDTVIENWADDGDGGLSVGRADADRLTICVNALAGVPKPEGIPALLKFCAELARDGSDDLDDKFDELLRACGVEP